VTRAVAIRHTTVLSAVAGIVLVVLGLIRVRVLTWAQRGFGHPH
jgi:hypothetical protein